MPISGNRSSSRRARISATLVAASLAATPVWAAPRAKALGASWEYELEGNPSTGYTWRLDEAASTGLASVEVKALGYRENTTGLVGAPAQFVFRFTCVAPGDAHLVFAYVGPTGARSDKTHEAWVRCD